MQIVQRVSKFRLTKKNISNFTFDSEISFENRQNVCVNKAYDLLIFEISLHFVFPQDGLIQLTFNYVSFKIIKSCRKKPKRDVEHDERATHQSSRCLAESQDTNGEELKFFCDLRSSEELNQIGDLGRKIS